MKRIYLVKKDERLPAAEDNWIEMNAHQFAQFLKTDTGAKTGSFSWMLHLKKAMPCFTNAPKMNIRCGKESGKVIYTRTAGNGRVDTPLFHI